MTVSNQGVKMSRRCLRKGYHRWRQKVWGQVGTEICARYGCMAERDVLTPPWTW